MEARHRALFSQRRLSRLYACYNAAVAMQQWPYPHLRTVQGIFPFFVAADGATLTCHSCPGVVGNRRRCHKGQAVTLTRMPPPSYNGLFTRPVPLPPRLATLEAMKRGTITPSTQTQQGLDF